MAKPPSAKASEGAPARQRGSGWFEFAVAAIVLSILAAILIRQLAEYQAVAEQTVVDLTLRNMRSGLRWQVAERLIHGRIGELAALEGANPVAWLADPPQGYAGEITGGESAQQVGELAPGSWYFDRSRRQLAYLPRHAWRSGPAAGTARERRWQVQTLKSSAAPAVSAPVAGLVLAEVPRAE